eukprot:6192558-Pleurochrysis_carterae.AAC.1
MAGAAVGIVAAGCVLVSDCNVSEASGRNAAIARAMIKFKSGGYAADCCEIQDPSGVFVPRIGLSGSRECSAATRDERAWVQCPA